MNIEQSDDIHQQASAWRAVWELLITLPIFEDYRVSSQPTGKGAALLALTILSEPKDRAEIESLRKRVAELEQIDEYTAEKLTAHAEAASVNPDHIDYIEETTKAIVAMWASNSELKARAEHLQAALEQARDALALRWNPAIPQWENAYDETERIISAALAADTAKPNEEVKS